MTTFLIWQDPIDLSLIQRKLENNFYASVPMFLADVRRTCSYRSFTVYLRRRRWWPRCELRLTPPVDYAQVCRMCENCRLYNGDTETGYWDYAVRLETYARGKCAEISSRKRKMRIAL